MTDTKTHNKVMVRILDKEFIIACAPESEAALTTCASYLHDQMLPIKKTGKILGIDGIAIMAALNIIHELLALKNAPPSASLQDVEDKLDDLSRKIDSAICPDH